MSTTRVRAKVIAAEFADLLSLEAAAKALPQERHPGTLLRWIKHGLRVGDKRIRLRAVKFGKSYFVRTADLLAFGQELGDAEHAST